MMTQPLQQPWQDPNAGRALPPDPGPAPGVVRTAAILLYVQVGLGLVSLVFMPGTMDRAMAQQAKAPGVDPAMLESMVNTMMSVTIVMILIWFGVWILFIVKAGQGRNWARTVLTVFVAIGLASAPFTIPQFVSGVAPPAQLLVTIPSLIIDVLVLVLFWREPAKSWFPAKTAYDKTHR